MAASQRMCVVLGFAMSVLVGASAQHCGNRDSCIEEDSPKAKVGGAMLQTLADKDLAPGATASFLNLGRAATASEETEEMKAAPLKGRVDGVEKAIHSLRSRVATLNSEVGVAGAGPAPVVEETAEAVPAEPEAAEAAAEPAAELLERKKKYASPRTDEDEDGSGSVEAALSELSSERQEDVSLLQDEDTLSSLKSKVAAAEKDMANIKSQISTLENQVSGSAFASQASLLDLGGSSLKSRIVSLEDDEDACRTRVTALEHIVLG